MGVFGKKPKAAQAVASVPPARKLAPAPSADVREIELQGEVRDRLKTQDAALGRIKQALGDLALEQAQLDAKRGQLINAVFNGSNRYNEIVNEAAASVGIDVNDPNYSGLWLFNQEVSKFIRNGPAPVRLEQPEKKEGKS